MGSLDRGGRDDTRQRRAMQRLAFSPSNTIGNTPIGDSSGLVYDTGNLGIKLVSNSGLSLSTSGLSILLATDPALVLGASGIKVLLAATPGLSSSGGLHVLLDTNSGLQTTTGLKLVLNGSTLTLSGSGLSVSAPEGIWTVTGVKTADYSPVIGELVRADASASGFNVTLPTAAGQSGRSIAVKLVVSPGANTVTVGTTGSETIDGSSTDLLAATLVYHKYTSDGTNWMLS